MHQRFIALVVVAMSALTIHAEPPKGPVKVFLLAGQSNMEGHGIIKADPKRNDGKGSLEYLVKNPATAKRFAHLVDRDGAWKKRDDVWVSYFTKHGPLTAGFGVKEDRIGPELGFGWVIGDAIEEPVLLIKACWGGKSLAIDFRPPSAGKPAYPLGAKLQADIDANPAILGKYYRETLAIYKDTLANLKTIAPELANRPTELVGFGWHQGWNDRISDQYNGEYEKNFAHFVRDMRKDLNSPRLPFVIAETGMNGPDETHPRALSLMKAQAAVTQYPEFKGNVAFVGTKNFWRNKEDSPSNQGYHWNTNAETYYLIGAAMGEAMKELLQKK